MRQGYDAPAMRNRDYLQRSPFARDVYSIAVNCPKEWSVRIGVYGDWGAGKSTVLHYVEEFAKADNHRVIWLNPWKFDHEGLMWHSFVESVAASVYGDIPRWYEITGKDYWKAFLTKRNPLIHNLMPSIPKLRPLSKLTGETERLTEVGATILSEWLLLNKEDLTKLIEELNGRRIIVLVDDLDRAAPSLIPRLLYAFKELLDVSGISFVLAFDPTRIATILSSQQLAWGQDLAFLEKIIEFPLWLPRPTKESLLALARSDLSLHCDYIDPKLLEDVFDVLPTNPRSLRLFVRHLWSIREQVQRHDPDELDWQKLILLNLMKAQFPEIANALFDSDATMEELLGYHPVVSKDGHVTEDTSRRSDVVCNLFEKFGVVNRDSKLGIELLINRLGRLHLTYDLADTRRLAFLVERPVIMTRREFNGLFGQWQSGLRPEAVGAWMDKVALSAGHGRNPVIRSLFKHAVDRINASLAAATESNLMEEIRLHLDVADKALGLATVAAIELDGFKGTDPALGAEALGQLLGTIAGWLPFEHLTGYKDFLAKGKARITAICSLATAHVEELLECFRPWDTILHAHPQRSISVSEFKDAWYPLTEKVAELIITSFERPGWIDRVTSRQMGHRGEKYVFLQSRGPLWGSDRRETFAALLAKAWNSPAIQNNAVDLLIRLPSLLDVAHSPFDEYAKELVKAEAIMRPLWQAAVCKPLNLRTANSLWEAAIAIRDECGIELERPDWWDPSYEPEVGRGDHQEMSQRS